MAYFGSARKEMRMKDPDLAQSLSLDEGLRKELVKAVLDYHAAFLATLPEGKAYHGDADAGAALASLPFRESGYEVRDILEVFHRSVTENGINPASGRHFGYVPGGGLETAAWGDFLAAVTNRYSGVHFANPGAARMENQVIAWMCRLVGYEAGSYGSLLSGGSLANLTGIIAARDRSGLRARDFERSVVYLTQETHHCVQKALRLAGMGEALLQYVPMDECFRMNTSFLVQAIRDDRNQGRIPFMIIGSAGTTNTGAIDPLEQLAMIAEKEEIWFHVDAAYGGFFLLNQHLGPRFRGLERADSIVMDPHKSLFMPYGTGVILVRRREDLLASNHYTAAYLRDSLPEGDELSAADYSPELTRHFRGMRIWFSLTLLGQAPFRQSLAEKIALSAYFQQEIAKRGFATGPEPELSISLFRWIPGVGDANEANNRLLAAVHADGRIFISSTTLNGLVWLRMAILVFRARQADVDFALRVLEDLRDGLEG